MTETKCWKNNNIIFLSVIDGHQYRHQVALRMMAPHHLDSVAEVLDHHQVCLEGVVADLHHYLEEDHLREARQVSASEHKHVIHLDQNCFSLVFQLGQSDY